MKLIPAVLLLLATVFALSACMRVKPYQRETLSKRAMQSPIWPTVTTGERHVFDVREGTGGATGSAAGGCGCN